MSIEEKYGVQTVKKPKERGEGTHKPQVKCSSNVFDDVNLETNFGKNSISKMVVVDANDLDNEIIIQKQFKNNIWVKYMIRKQVP